MEHIFKIRHSGFLYRGIFNNGIWHIQNGSKTFVNIAICIILKKITDKERNMVRLNMQEGLIDKK
jgi:hypothetical protein